MITYKNRDPSSDFEDKPAGNEECPLNLSFIRKSHAWSVLWHVTIKGNVGHYPFILNHLASRTDGITIPDTLMTLNLRMVT